MAREMTPRQETILRFIHDFQAEHDFPPSLVDIGAHFDLRPTREVTTHLDALARKGMLTREMYKSRCLVLTDAGLRAIGEVPKLRGKFVYFWYDQETGGWTPLCHAGSEAAA